MLAWEPLERIAMEEAYGILCALSGYSPPQDNMNTAAGQVDTISFEEALMDEIRLKFSIAFVLLLIIVVLGTILYLHLSVD